MFDSFGIEIPIRRKTRSFFHINSKLTVSEDCDYKKPFVSVDFYDSSKYAALKFLEAVRLNQIDKAVSYISKNYMDRIDIGSLSLEVSEEINLCSHVVCKNTKNKPPKNCSANTFLLVDNKGKNPRIFHIYMLREPDHLGKWKVYNIEQE